MQRVVVTTGGTGGHIFPALAVAQALQEEHADMDVLFVGGDRGPEGRLAARAGLEFAGLPARGVLGRGLRSLGSLWWLSRSFLKCWLLFRSFKPQAVLGFGSYAGFVPVLLGAWKKIPTGVHEQNSQPGVTNRILGKRVDRVFLSFPDHKGYFDPRKVQVTGNPVRSELIALRDREKKYAHKPKGQVLILGGSQGARAINEAVVKSLAGFKSQGIRLMHQTGTADLQWVSQAYQDCGMDDDNVQAFIDDMASAYAWADLVICRAGASTLAELTVIGLPSILIPFPYAIHKHQLTNAQHLEDHEAAIVIEQSHLHEINLTRAVADLINVPGRILSMGQAAKRLGNPNAARDIVQEMSSLSSQTGQRAA